MRVQEAEIRKQEAEVRAQEEILRKQLERLKELLIKELIRDKLISDIDDYEIRFKKGKLYINDNEQSNALYKKYKNLYEEATGKKLDDSSNFRLVNRK